MAHKWTKDDELLAYYLFKKRATGFQLKVIAMGKGIKEEEMRARMEIFKTLESGADSPNATQQTKDIFEDLNGASAEELEDIVQPILTKKTG